MLKHDPIFSAKGDRQRIGHIEGNEAFDLSGEKRCNYNPATGNLCDPNSGKIIGHVTLQGKFVGPSWVAVELFSQNDRQTDSSVATRVLSQADSGVPRAKAEVTNLLLESHDPLPAAAPLPFTGVAVPEVAGGCFEPVGINYTEYEARETNESLHASDKGVQANDHEARATLKTADPDDSPDDAVHDREPIHGVCGQATSPRRLLSASYYRRRAEALRFALITTRKAERAIRLRAFIEKYRALADRADAELLFQTLPALDEDDLGRQLTSSAR